MFKENFSYKDLYSAKYKTKNICIDPLVNFKKREAQVALGFTIISMILFYYMKIDSNLDILNNQLREILLYLGTAFVGILGFVLSGIAIVSGTMNMQLLRRIDKSDHYDEIILILMGFWYISKKIALTIGLFVLTYFLIILPCEIINIVFYIFSFILLYLFYFIIFYMTSLFETCIKIVNISYKYTYKEADEVEKNKEFESINNHELCNHVKANAIIINALVEHLLCKSDLTLENFSENINGYIKDMVTIEEVEPISKIINGKYPDIISKID